jgi:alkanesulfonate monooxygenase SsuD/methylene tetrahydromethanopterin reductase-like flavin-dependent oxidoreductase (luciferase family)
VKKIGFLSFGHWMDHPDSQVRSAADTLLQSIDLAQAAEEVGADGAYFRVHHYAQQLGSPTALLAAVGAKTQRIELGTGVVDMRYPDPFGFAEDMASVDLISGGRLQLGLSRADCCGWSPTRPACVSASGGVRGPTPRRGGPRSTA